MTKYDMIYAKCVMQGIKPNKKEINAIADNNSTKACFKAMMQVARIINNKGAQTNEQILTSKSN